MPGKMIALFVERIYMMMTDVKEIFSDTNILIYATNTQSGTEVLEWDCFLSI